MSQGDQKRWDRKYGELETLPAASELLKRHLTLLRGGLALDVACGSGQNSIWLAQHGYQVLGVDISRRALEWAEQEAVAAGVQHKLLFVQADLDVWRSPANRFDLVVVFRFLDRSLLSTLQESVRPGGLFFYRTRHVGILNRQPEATRAFLLEKGELTERFAGWQLLEEHEGTENASVVARKQQ